MPSPVVHENAYNTYSAEGFEVDLEMGSITANKEVGGDINMEDAPIMSAIEETRATPRPSYDFKLPAVIARIRYARSREEQFNTIGYTCPRITSSIPPPNFGAVVKGKIYRSGFPSVENLDFMETLGLRTILTLVEGPHPEPYSQWIADNFKDHYTIPLPANKDVVRIRTPDMAKVMAIVTNPENYPLLIHCNKGKHRTGCVVGTFRKCTGVDMDDIISEYHDYASNKARTLDETYIKNVQPFEVVSLSTDDVRHDSATESDSAFLRTLPRIVV